MITQSTTKEEREAGDRGVILGNTRVFYKGESKSSSSASLPKAKELVSEDVPF